MRVIVAGAAGMLGREVVRAVGARGHEVHGFDRNRLDITNGCEVMQAIGRLRPDVVINAAGIVKGRQGGERQMVAVNAVGPHTLAEIADMYGVKVVHVSTDCVFAGKRAAGLRYYEDDTPDPVDLYGRSKLAGEVTRAPHLTVRASCIGLGERGLLAWLLAQSGEVPGYCEVYWNGFTAPYLARILVQQAERGTTGLLHLGTMAAVQKCELLEMLIDAFNLDLKVIHTQAPGGRLNRCLNSSRSEAQAYTYMDLPAMVDDLAREYRRVKA